MSKKKCVKTYFSREIICAGSMTEYIIIYRNEIKPTKIGEIQTIPEKTILYELFGIIDEVNPVARWGGVKMTANSPEGKSTHVFYIPFEQTIYELDINKLFVEIERTRNRIFKMNKIENYGESDNYLAIWCNELGFADVEAAAS